mmetsp:Transcript_14582/g.32154  ORF Transcript_14582/g.32154 Transcript_14582/m.32154 type:complete len:104 (+) Transcript_14582:119-430(+)|eukprot:CAMPEP_0173178598 /NCGR_PEP_ID=MMETSP1141-20130122/5628_1 /TAXON_ID=483371 /ORGANISM="non described non described, Strain CCMP2298" /LENGTH=103 /DNA_ID=CAMNT_0014101113 /DNA_START=115 /DNA_END=426 /DNA_ORIENTATION=-
MSYIACAKCCSLFSLSGIVFLVIIGSLLQSQPLYIKGPEDSSAAAKGCYEGAMLYLATFLLSVGYWMFDSLKAKSPPLSPLMNRAPPSNSYGGKYGAVVNDSF